MSVFWGGGGGWWLDLETKETSSRGLQQQWQVFADQKYGLEVRLKKD